MNTLCCPHKAYTFFSLTHSLPLPTRSLSKRVCLEYTHPNDCKATVNEHYYYSELWPSNLKQTAIVAISVIFTIKRVLQRHFIQSLEIVYAKIL